MRPDILHDIEAYYTARVGAHGATPQGVDWNGPESHELRHRQFLRLLDGAADASVLDLGCGYGDFLRFLRANGHHGSFVGYDVSPDMIAQARRLHGETSHCIWRIGADPDEVADFTVASGIFNVKGDISIEDWGDHVDTVIDVLAKSSRRGFAFNVLSLSSDPERRRPDLYFADPVKTLENCLSRFGRSVALLQDYGLFEFTIIVRHTNS